MPKAILDEFLHVTENGVNSNYANHAAESVIRLPFICGYGMMEIAKGYDGDQ